MMILEFYQASAGQWRQGLFRRQHGPTLWLPEGGAPCDLDRYFAPV